MDEEIEIFKPKMDVISVKRIVEMEFIVGKLFGANVVVVRCGIGKVNAAICVQVLSDLFGVDYVINTGVAGGIEPTLSVCDIVISKDVVQHDFDATIFGYDPGIIPRMPASYFEADDMLVKLAAEACAKVAPERKTLVGRIASGDLFVAQKEDRERLVKHFGAYCTEMEGAAIGHACYLNKIPFVVIRSMSDTADHDAKDDFKTNAEIAAKQSGAIVEYILRHGL